MRGKAQHDSFVLVLLAPPGEYDGMIRKLVPSEDSNSSKEDGSNDCPVQNSTTTQKSAKVAISNSFCTVHVPIADAE